MKRPIPVVFPVLFFPGFGAPSAPLPLEPTPLPQAGGPEPAYLALCGGLLVIIAVVIIVIFLRRRKEQPRRTQLGGALAELAQPQDASEARRAEKGRALHAVVFTLNLLSKFVAFIFAVLFIVTALLALLLFNVGRQFFDPGLYKRALVEQHIYEKFPALVAEQLASQLAYVEKRAGIDTENMTASPELEACLRRALGDEAFNALAGSERQPDDAEIERMRPCFAQHGEVEGDGRGGPPPALPSLTPADWEALLPILIPRDWMQAQAESVIDQAFAFIDSDDPAPAITISMAGLKEHLAGGAAVEAFLHVVRSQPPCTDEQLAVLASEPGLPTCRPPEAMLNSMAQEGAQILGEVIGNIPDEVNLSEIFRGEDEGPLGDNPRQVLQRIRWGLNLSPLLPAALLLLVTLFGVRSLKGWLCWWGISFLLVGLAGLGLAVAALPAMDWAIATYVVDRLPPTLSPNLAQAGLDVGRYIMRTPVTWIGVEAGVIALAGLVLLLGLFFIGPKRNRKSKGP